ncbi:hypothetical protein SRB17_29900 [Streptomyces sp. RB17]|uniref:hypothetical protein n=1 Tax=Streptomyces sp. RB17 TaxID=2585197 RepID=UPI001306FF98|nr:hypothetical protein [Streptomyces sp. RB17]MQY35018.1 hypothetical protein [Streptomyces sp. RB17]
MAIDYDGRRFRPVGTDEHEAARQAVYHQRDDLLWGEFSGGDARRGTLTGTVAEDGGLDFVYGVVLTDGRVVAGSCRSVPEVLDDGRIRLTETWQRYGKHAASGVSYLEELPGAQAGPGPHAHGPGPSDSADPGSTGSAPAPAPGASTGENTP